MQITVLTAEDTTVKKKKSQKIPYINGTYLLVVKLYNK